MTQKFDDILGTVGNTPVIRINRLAPEGVNLYVKFEAFNPLGSVKDRLALGVIEAAEKSGELKPGPGRFSHKRNARRWSHLAKRSLHAPECKPVWLGEHIVTADLHDLFANDEHLVALIHAVAERQGSRLEYSAAEVYHLWEGLITKRQAFANNTEEIRAFFA